MQTFLPYATHDFADVAQVLDRQRLNKQALEGWQILMTLLELDPAGNHREPKGWRNHPAVRMWAGYESALLNYIVEMVIEWKRRGYKSTIADKAMATFDRAVELGLVWENGTADLPHWMHEPIYDDLASSHRTALLVKDYEWYSQFGWSEGLDVRPTEYDYIWITKEKA
jgi:hypothetical protein